MDTVFSNFGFRISDFGFEALAWSALGWASALDAWLKKTDSARAATAPLVPGEAGPASGEPFSTEAELAAAAFLRVQNLHAQQANATNTETGSAAINATCNKRSAINRLVTEPITSASPTVIQKLFAGGRRHWRQTMSKPARKATSCHTERQI